MNIADCLMYAQNGIERLYKLIDRNDAKKDISKVSYLEFTMMFEEFLVDIVNEAEMKIINKMRKSFKTYVKKHPSDVCIPKDELLFYLNEGL